MSTLEQVADDLNESPALIVLCEKASAEEKSAIATALKAPADAVFAAAAAADAEPEMMFAIGEASGNIADQVRRLTKLEESKGVAMVLLDIPDNGTYYVAGPGGGDCGDGGRREQVCCRLQGKVA